MFALKNLCLVVLALLMLAPGLTELSKRDFLDGCHADTLDFCDSAVHNTENILDYVHADLVWPYFLKQKSAFESFKVWSGSPYDYSHLEQLSVFSWKRCLIVLDELFILTHIYLFMIG
ncbi:hypothetical protein ACJX0J_039753, partial [Zea mays]